MFVVWRHQSAPHLSAFTIEAQYPISVVSYDQIKPFFQFLGLWHIAATPDVLQSSPNFTDCLHGEIDVRSINFLEEFPNTGIRPFSLASIADDSGVHQVHADSSQFRRLKSESSPTLGILARTSATDRRFGCCRTAFRISRCSASALLPCDAASCFSARATSSSTLRTTRFVAIASCSYLQSLIAIYRNNNCIAIANSHIAPRTPLSE